MRASDIHCTSGDKPIVRIDGELLRFEDCNALEERELEGLIDAILDARSQELCRSKDQFDCAVELAGISRFRLNVFRHSKGLGAAFRVIPSAVPTLETLDLPAVVGALPALASGLVLVTGPTGSGKSTTLAALVDILNKTVGAHVITIEDPIEFAHHSKRGLIHQREVGVHTDSFAGALRSALREDPDAIMIGELRDLETTQLALTAAETGHLVLASVHSARAHTTIDRIIDIFPAAQQPQVRSMLAESLQAVVTQSLQPRVGGGRVVLAEVLIGTAAVRNLIRESKTHQLPGVMQVSRNVGMQTFDAHVEELRRKGLLHSDCYEGSLHGKTGA